MSSPSRLIVPEVGSSRRMAIIDVVDLPQPDSPTRPTLSSAHDLEADAVDRAERRRSACGALRRKSCEHALGRALARIFLHQILDFQKRPRPCRLHAVAAAGAGRRPRRGDRARSTPGRGVARISLRV